MPSGGPTVYVAKIPHLTMNITDSDVLNRRIIVVIQRWEDRISAEPRDRESTAVVRIGRRQNLREGHNRTPSAATSATSRSFRHNPGPNRLKSDLSKNLVSVLVSEEENLKNTARNERLRCDERRESDSSRCLLHVTLREVVNPRLNRRNLHRRSGGCPPYRRIN
uniref:Uncharacterized protein n=1 Tax=Opuntia streptacantha TaxID=393608 RepID=A0A7C9E6L2_OPUST